jgi:hypothetical protein
MALILFDLNICFDAHRRAPAPFALVAQLVNLLADLVSASIDIALGHLEESKRVGVCVA